MTVFLFPEVSCRFVFGCTVVTQTSGQNLAPKHVLYGTAVTSCCDFTFFL